MLVLIDVVSVFLGVAAMRLAWRVIMATYSGWFAFRMEPVGYVKMFVFVLIGYLLVLGLDFRRISPSPSRRSVTSANRSSEAMVMSAISRAMAAPEEMAMPASASEKENAASAAHKKTAGPFRDLRQYSCRRLPADKVGTDPPAVQVYPADQQHHQQRKPGKRIG